MKHIKLHIKGIVQGVGFRPFVHNLALSMNLKGYILNDSRGVTIEAEGPEEVLGLFANAIETNPPALAVIQEISQEINNSLENYESFFIKKSYDKGEKTVLISPDTSVCADCLREMKNPADPRYHYPFINCTNCGPRFTIITDVPYDRHNTSMAEFPMCSLCKSQYEDPADRRFHAQPVACPVCGPHIVLKNSKGETIETDSESCIEKTADLLKKGAVIAVKGIGGYHLAADALNEEAVKKIRSRKFREDKPFAVMMKSAEEAEKFCFASDTEKQLMSSFRSPVVLLEKKKGCPIAPSTAPDNNYLGVMLPYTPLHNLIMDRFGSPLVMTSGNISEEPIAYKDDDALERLSSIADYFLIHNRPIHIRCDDSVVRIFNNREYPLRRSRGYVPFPVLLKEESKIPVLAVGGELKNTFCILRANQAFLSHHIGDLENEETYDSFTNGISHFRKLLGVEPTAIAYDMHPRYLSTAYAAESEIKTKIPVQHHHAHIVSCMADNEINGEVIGIALDGVGYGDDHRLWGCEFFLADETSYTRKIHLDYVKLPGGEKAIREPWRTAAAYLFVQMGEKAFNCIPGLRKSVSEDKISIVSDMIENNINSPLISSAGRLFDAAAAIAGVNIISRFEGQAAITLEMIADKHETGEYPIEFITGGDMKIINPYPILFSLYEDIKKGAEKSTAAGKFHNTAASMAAAGAEIIRNETGNNRVVLSGGVFQNMILLGKVITLLEKKGFDVFFHRRVPCNDGGISLGQAVIAANRIRKI